MKAAAKRLAASMLIGLVFGAALGLASGYYLGEKDIAGIVGLFAWNMMALALLLWGVLEIVRMAKSSGH